MNVVCVRHTSVETYVMNVVCVRHTSVETYVMNVAAQLRHHAIKLGMEEN